MNTYNNFFFCFIKLIKYNKVYLNTLGYLNKKLVQRVPHNAS